MGKEEKTLNIDLNHEYNFILCVFVMAKQCNALSFSDKEQVVSPLNKTFSIFIINEYFEQSIKHSLALARIREKNEDMQAIYQ